VFISCLLSLIHVYVHVFTFQAHIEQWIDFSSLEIDANMLKWFAPRMGYAPFSAPVSFPSFFVPCLMHSLY